MRPVFAQFNDMSSRPRPPVAALRVALCAVAILGTLTSVFAQSNQTLRVVPLVKDDHVLVCSSWQEGYGRSPGCDPERPQDHLHLQRRTPAGRAGVGGSHDLHGDGCNQRRIDNLTRTNNVVRMLDGRVEQAISTQNDNVVRTWLTNLVRLPLFNTSLLEPNRDYYIRVSATARPTNGSILWPFGSGPSAQSRFTFIR